MTMKTTLVGVIFLLTSIAAQQDSCSCSCCMGLNCSPLTLPTLVVSYCTLNKCLEQCRAAYSQCQSSYPNGIITPQCVSTNVQQFSCRCDCCYTNSGSCLPVFVGLANAYTCQSGSCSISCAQQYPNQCQSNQNGQTQGNCIGSLTTTTSTTTSGSWLGNTCSCMCCNNGTYCSPLYVVITSDYQCSLTSCTQACQIRYPLTCPSSMVTGQTNGTCINSNIGLARCRCNCCSNTGCITYELNTNGNCTSCDAACRHTSICINPHETTSVCYTNGADMLLRSVLVGFFHRLTIGIILLSVFRKTS
jgi:hypothetical protein